MNKQELVLLDWARKVHQLEYAHCFQSLYFSKVEHWIGLSAFFVATVVAFAYRFPFISYPCVKEYILPLLAFTAAILTGYQSFIKPGEKAEMHRKLGLEYEKIRHEMEVVITSTNTTIDLEEKIKSIKEKWDSLSTVYVNERHYVAAKAKVKSFNKYGDELAFLPDLV